MFSYLQDISPQLEQLRRRSWVVPSETLTTRLGSSMFLSMLTFRRFRFVASVRLSPYIPALRYAVSLATRHANLNLGNCDPKAPSQIL